MCFVPLNNVLTLSIVLWHKPKCARAYSFCAQTHLNVPRHNATIDRDCAEVGITAPIVVQRCSHGPLKKPSDTYGILSACDKEYSSIHVKLAPTLAGKNPVTEIPLLPPVYT